ncbi:MAG: branched-chain amino acid ABC transporter permease [Defluviitaleaceae bacterium]|nr:branched-chain amino acid ABC transporter permease [Defluviitaleaceae bacterium]
MDRYKLASIFGSFAIAAALPLFLDNYSLNVLWNAMFYMLLALGLNVIVGYCGLCDLGYAAKFAIGAYTTGILVKTFAWNFWLTIPVVIVVSLVFAVLIGGPTLKLRSDYLAIVTLGFAEIVRITARNLSLTGAASGLNGIMRPSVFGTRITTISQWYYVFLILLALFVVISYRTRYSRFGRALAYIREDEDAAKAMGVNATLYKLYAYMLGAVLGGVTGSFYAVKMTSISPNSFDFTQSANILLAVILGGMGKIPGVIAGAAFFAIFPELFRDVPVIGEMRMLFFGLLLVIVMITRPQGLWPETKGRALK